MRRFQNHTNHNRFEVVSQVDGYLVMCDVYPAYSNIASPEQGIGRNVAEQTQYHSLGNEGYPECLQRIGFHVFAHRTAALVAWMLS